MDQINDKDLQLIEKHFAGTLSKEEELLFQEKIKQANFKKQLDQIQLLEKGVKTFERRRLKNMLREHAQSNQSGEKKVNPQIEPNQRFTKFLKFAAALIGISILIWCVIKEFEKETPDYFAEYFTPQKNVLSQIQKSTTDTSLLQLTFSHYENGEYAKAISSFDSLLEIEPDDDYRYYQANALVAENRNDEAISTLTSLIQRNKSQFIPDAKWLLALVYLKTEQQEKARPLLEQLSSHSFYRSKAETILETLN